ncbi:type II toxin-antitoxin system VapB family antitoxin [Streptomyces sp. NBC_01506]|uniref:type II toxin-antitoxin system VapB family antitoxin n=1 Tax=Streptomyces sp. NBC_01506 TaxID=2903887 RepID=UPI003867A38B
MSLTTIDLDDEAVADAMRVSGAGTKEQAVNTALREFTARHRRVATPEEYASLAQGWDHESWERQRASEKRGGR